MPKAVSVLLTANLSEKAEAMAFKASRSQKQPTSSSLPDKSGKQEPGLSRWTDSEKELIRQQLRTGNAAMRVAVRARGYTLAPRLAAKAKAKVPAAAYPVACRRIPIMYGIAFVMFFALIFAVVFFGGLYLFPGKD